MNNGKENKSVEGEIFCYFLISLDFGITSYGCFWTGTGSVIIKLKDNRF